MRRFSDLELLLIDGFELNANSWDDGRIPITANQLIEWAVKNGKSELIPNAESAKSILDQLKAKLIEPENPESKEGLAIWLINRNFSERDLRSISGKDILKFLQGWKYANCFGADTITDAYCYMAKVIDLKNGFYVPDPQNNLISYIRSGSSKR